MYPPRILGELDFTLLPTDRTWVFLTCFNRKALAQVALESLLQQTAVDLTIIVSDNSTENDLEDWLREARFPREIFYVHWRPTLPPPYGHLAKVCGIVDRVKPAAWQIFHDDDIALPHMIRDLRAELDAGKNLAAVAGNAIDFNKAGPLGRFRQDRSDVIFQTVPALLSRYFLPSSGVSPCPAYLFRPEVASIAQAGFRGGKYVDIWMNSYALKHGAIKWLQQPVMLYRRHEAQDSHGHSCRDKFALFNAIVESGAITKSHRLYRWFFIQNFKHHARRLKPRPQWGRSRAYRLTVKWLMRAMIDPVVCGLFLRKIFWRLRERANKDYLAIYEKFNERSRKV